MSNTSDGTVRDDLMAAGISDEQFGELCERVGTMVSEHGWQTVVISLADECAGFGLDDLTMLLLAAYQTLKGKHELDYKINVFPVIEDAIASGAEEGWFSVIIAAAVVAKEKGAAAEAQALMMVWNIAHQMGAKQQNPR